MPKLFSNSLDKLKNSFDELTEKQITHSKIIKSSTKALNGLNKKTEKLGSSVKSTVTKFKDSENVFAKGIKGAVSIFAPELALLPDAFEGVKSVFDSMKDFGGNLKKSFKDIISAPKQLKAGYKKTKEFLGFSKKSKEPEKKQQSFLSKVYEKILKTDKRELKLSRDEKKINLKDLKIAKKTLKIDEKDLKISKKEFKLEKKQTKALKNIKENTKESLMSKLFGENRGVMDLLGLGGMLPGGRGGRGGRGGIGGLGGRPTKGGVFSKILKGAKGPGKILGMGAGLLGGAASMFGLPDFSGMFGGDTEEQLPTTKITPKAKPSKILGKAGGEAEKGIFKKILGKAGGKAAKKGIAKGLGKSLLKKIPGIGAVAGLGFGVSRLMSGDILGAIGETASGFASIIPGIGTAASTAIDAALIARDVAKSPDEGEEQKSKVDKLPPELQPSKLKAAGKLSPELQPDKLKKVSKLPPELKTKKAPVKKKSLFEKAKSVLKMTYPPAIIAGLVSNITSSKKVEPPASFMGGETASKSTLTEIFKEGKKGAIPAALMGAAGGESFTKVFKDAEKEKAGVPASFMGGKQDQETFSKMFSESPTNIEKIIIQKETPVLDRVRTNIVKESEQTTSIPTSLEKIKTMTSTKPSKPQIPDSRDPQHAANTQRSFGNFNNQPDDYRLVFITTGGQ